jgi:hypothetical protein
VPLAPLAHGRARRARTTSRACLRTDQAKPGGCE